MLLDDREYYEVARTFGDLEMTQEEIGNAGLKLMVRWYAISLWISHSCQIVAHFSEKKIFPKLF